MTVSMLVLTYNRGRLARECLEHNYRTAGRKIDELIWVDNGSADCTRELISAFNPDVSIIHNRNFGVAKGYNRGYAMASCDFVVKIDDDCKMPEGWLLTFERAFQAIPDCGAICSYSHSITDAPERVRGMEYCYDGMRVMEAMPMESRMVRREFFMKQIGYYREDFGLYGWEDVEWADRAIKVCRQHKLRAYVLLDMIYDHLGETCLSPEEKAREVNDPAKHRILAWAADSGYPYVNPYGRS